MDVQEAIRFLKENNVKFVLAQFVDIHGVAKAKAVPVHHFEDILNDGAGFAGFAIWGMGQEPNDPDYMAVGDLSTLSLVPWQPGFARIVCDGRVKGKPWPNDSRYILKQQLKRFTDRGLTVNTGLEPEFMLVRRTDDGGFEPADNTDILDKPCYDYKGLSRSRAFIERLVDCMMAVGIDVYQVDHEDGNGQFEVNFTYSDAMTTADRIVFFRMGACEIAREFGALCTFMPKPTATRTGSGMHMHISLSDGKKNLFHDPSDGRNLELSKLAYQFLGGLMAHAPALTAICAPCVNSYKRLVVGRSFSGATWAPAYVSYGDNNRTSMVRVPTGGRLEMRLPDSSCNPYLGTAAVIAAGLDGIERKLDPGEPRNFNHYKSSPEELSDRGIKVLPQSLNEALNALDEDTLLCDQLGRGFVDEFIRLKRMEWVDYHRHVSDWEVRRYLEFH